MSRFSERRLVQELAMAVGGDVKIRRRNDFGVFLVSLGIGAFGNFYFGKVEVGVAFLIIALLALADLVCSTWNWRGIKRTAFDLAFAVLVLWFFSGWLWGQYRSQHSALTSGDLVAPSDGKDHSKEPPLVTIGMNGGTTFVWNGPKNKEVIGVASDKVFVRKSTDGTILLTTTVKDRAGNMIVKITDNHWEISPNKAECWDKNYTDNVLEVKNGRDRIVLQIRLLANEIQIQGEWDDRGYSAPEVIDAMGQYSDEDGIAPLFKYPSSQHWGEFINANDYRLINR